MFNTLNSLATATKENRLADIPFIVITPDSVSKAPTFSDSLFYERSTEVIFEVNKTNLRKDQETMRYLFDVVIPRINNEHLQLRKLYIRGAASPEGPYENNRRLGQGRSKALLDEISRALPHQYRDIDTEISSVTEDYGYLCLLMQKAGDQDYAIVKHIYDQCNGDELSCKRQLSTYANGTLWRRLLKEYFPKLRAARVILWFSEPDQEHAPVTTTPLAMERMERLGLNPEPPIVRPAFDLNIDAEPFTFKPKRRHLIAVRTNLLHDLFYMPQYGWANSTNIQLEYYPLDGHYTYNIGMTWGTHRRWGKQKFFQVRDFQLELRRYFKGGGVFRGAYMGAYVHGNKYGIGLSQTKGWQGEGGGAGATIGYVTALNRKKSLRLEFMAAAGFYMTLFDPYVYGNPITNTIDGYYYYDYLGTASNFKKRNHRFTHFGPTNLGIQLTYDIIYRKKQYNKANRTHKANRANKTHKTH